MSINNMYRGLYPSQHYAIPSHGKAAIAERDGHEVNLRPATDGLNLHYEIQAHNATREKLKNEVGYRLQVEQNMTCASVAYRASRDEVQSLIQQLQSRTKELDESVEENSRLTEIVINKDRYIENLQRSLDGRPDGNGQPVSALPTGSSYAAFTPRSTKYLAEPRSPASTLSEGGAPDQTTPCLPSIKRMTVPSVLAPSSQYGQLRLPTPRPMGLAERDEE